MSENEKQIQDLLIALTKMEKTQEATIEAQNKTTNNVDKIVTHLEKLLPVHTDIANIKKIIYGMIAVSLAYGAWATVEYHRIDNELKIIKAVADEKEKELKKNLSEKTERINKNENQITYVKGRVTGMERRSENPSTYINAGNRAAK